MTMKRSLILMMGIMSILLILSGCSSSSGGADPAATSDGTVDTGTGDTGTGDTGTGDTGTGDTNTGNDTTNDVVETVATRISGKVTLSSVLSGKARQKIQAMNNVSSGKPGSALHKATTRKKSSVGEVVQYRGLPTRQAGESAAGATVQLFDAGHPEWLHPIAEAVTDASGNYELSKLINAEKNGNKYKDGDEIAEGNYTLVAIEKDATGAVVSVANQTVVNKFEGNVVNDLAPQKVTETPPKVVTMFGVKRNTDGTQTWGSNALTVSPNVALQVTFSMAVDRQTVENGISISPAVNGFWAIAPDGLTATLYLDEGVQLAQGQSYSLTVKGKVGVDTINAIKNMLGVVLDKDAVGYFSVPTGAQADIQAPTAQMVSPSLTDIASPDGIDIITPIRIGATEVMDVNDLKLSATPSLGAKPNVSYLGKGKSGLFEYGFVLGEPLKLGTAYAATVSGGKDLAGNEMNPLSVSFTTVSHVEGIVEIPADATVEEKEVLTKTANVQAEVKDVFGKWARAMNEFNLSQMQSLMASDFSLVYNTNDGFDSKDFNRDGRWDLAEFSDMMDESFQVWDYCGTTMTGDVVGAIEVTGDEAKFEFKLIGQSEQNTKTCADAAPKDSMFAKLQKINGAWFILQASEGVDAVAEEVVSNTLVIELTNPPKGAELELDDNSTEKFSWTEVPDAAAYVMMFIDDRDPKAGFAFILPPSYLDLDVPPNDELLFNENNPVAADVSSNFGFTREFDPRPGVEINWQIAALGKNTVKDVIAGRATDLVKDVIAVSHLSRFKLTGAFEELEVTVALAEVDDEGNPMAVEDAEEFTFSEFIDGYNADNADAVTITIDTPRPHQTMGIVNVQGNTFAHYPVTLEKVFDDLGNPVGATGSVTVKLNEGFNWIEVSDENFHAKESGGDAGMCDPAMDPNCDPNAGGMCDPAMDPNCDPNAGGMCDSMKDSNCPPPPADSGTQVQATNEDGGEEGGREYILIEWFNVQTTGGIAPVVTVDETTKDEASGDVTDSGVTDQLGSLIANDGWDFYEAKEATSVTITGMVDTSDLEGERTIDTLEINLWNDDMQAFSYRSVEVEDDGSYSVSMDLYEGENWIEIGGCAPDSNAQDADHCNMESWYSTHLGVYTEVGVEWVPPIVIDSVAYAEGDVAGEVVQKEVWGDGGNWRVKPADMEEPATTILIQGTLEFSSDTTDSSNTPRYSHGSEGGWMEDRLSVASDGSFELEIDVFTGWNNVSIRDVNDNWYNMNFHVEKGMKVVRPEIVTIDGESFEEALNEHHDYVTDQCFVEIEGMAMEGEVRIFWNGQGQKISGGWSQNWEEFVTETEVDEEGNYTFSAILPLIGGSEYEFSDNFVDINDANWNWFGVRIITTGDCAYSAPTMSVDTVTATVDSSVVTLEKVDVWTGFNEENVEVENGARFALPNAVDAWAPIATDAVTIQGTSSVAGRRVGAEMWVCNRQVKLPEVIASGTENEAGMYPWTMDVTLFPDHNRIEVRDGQNWYTVELIADNDNTPPPPPLNVSVLDAAGNVVAAFEEPGKMMEDTIAVDPCAGSDTRFNAGELPTVTISGTTQGRDGTGEWHSDGNFGRFDIVDGEFSFEMDLYDGHNWVNINDADWNNTGIEIFTNNGNQRPQFVVVESYKVVETKPASYKELVALVESVWAADDGTSIVHGDQVAPGLVVITGTIYGDPVNADQEVGFKADFVNAFVQSCGADGCSWLDYSSDPEATKWGAKRLVVGQPDEDGNVPFGFVTKVQSAGSNGTEGTGGTDSTQPPPDGMQPPPDGTQSTTQEDPKLVEPLNTLGGASTMIEVRADGQNGEGMWQGHGHGIELNSFMDSNCSECGPQERIWKPGQASNQLSADKSLAEKRLKVLRHR